MTRNSDGTVYLWRDYENYPYKQLDSRKVRTLPARYTGSVRHL